MAAAQFEQAVRDRVRRVVPRQVASGIDIVDDEEFGKLNWIAYLGGRLKGLTKIEQQTRDVDIAGFWPQRERFGEFYKVHALHKTRQWRPAVPSLPRSTGSQANDYENLICRAPLEYDPTAVLRDISNLKSALSAVAMAGAFMPVVAPGNIEVVPHEYYDSNRGQ